MLDQIVEEIVLSRNLTHKRLLIEDIVSSAIDDVRDNLNYFYEKELPTYCKGIVKDLALIRYNQLGSEGLKSESYSGVSQTYNDDIPLSIKRRLSKYRRLPR